MPVIFMNDQILDLDAFRTFGLHAKPSVDDPIGFFGTGLKYAVSIILRKGGIIRVLSNNEEYRFKTKDKQFRGENKTFVLMQKKNKKSNWVTYQLPFTLDLGKNWELWQAMRELESNTRDENGSSKYVETNKFNDAIGHTQIIVDLPEFDEAYNKIHEVFLDTELEAPWVTGDDFDIYRKPSKYFYYRGLRIMELPESSIYTWNFKPFTILTEDRTMKYDSLAKYNARDFIMQLDDAEVIRDVLNARRKSFESSFEWDHAVNRGSPVFEAEINAMKNRPARLDAYFNRYMTTSKVPEEDELIISLKEWLEEDILDVSKTDLLTRTIERLEDV